MLLFLFPASQAVSDEIYNKCMGSTEGQAEYISQCGNEWMDRAGQRLNEVWENLYDRLSERDEAKKLLMAEQRHWHVYKETSCNFYAVDPGKDIEAIYFSACRAKVIEQRTNDLKTYNANLK